MSDFVNTIDVLGDNVVLRSILDKTITEFSDDKLKSLKQRAFYKNENLLSVNLPNVTSLGLSYYPRTFDCCTSLKTVSMSKLSRLYNGLFSYCESLESFVLGDNITDIPEDCFYNCKSLTFDDVFLSKIKTIGSSGFYGCNGISNINLPSLTSISNYAFANCQNLKQVSIPSTITTLPDYTFRESGLESFDFSNITSIGSCCFLGCKIQNVDAPLLTKVGGNAFKGCTLLQSVNVPMLSDVLNANSLFEDCTSLKSIDLPKITKVSGNVFEGCTALESVNLPNLESCSGQSVFRDCTSLKEIYLPKLLQSGSFMFSGCSSLEKITLDNILSISNNDFQDCTNLTSLIIKSQNVCGLNGDFENDSYRGNIYFPNIIKGTGYVYVPSVMVNSYKTDVQWGKYASQIKSIDRGVFLNSYKSLLLYNSSEEFIAEFQCAMDEENISITSNNVSITTDNESIATVNNISVVDNIISFTVNTLAVAGNVNIIVKVNIGGNEYSTSTLLYVFEEVPEVTYSVEAVDGANYGFELNDDGYYESTNKGVSDSYSICKLSFFANGESNIYLDCINYAEANYDYGIISKIDQTLSLSAIAEKNVLTSFKDSGASSDVKTVSLGIPDGGEHFIYIKYIKDGRTDKNNDSFKFKVRVE